MIKCTDTTAIYEEQLDLWPSKGKHILARYDNDHIIVYQAYRKTIGSYATSHQRFGGEFCYHRMSWIKPNFLWMMYRSGWATKVDQEIILAVTITRTFFDKILSIVVPTSISQDSKRSHTEWKRALESSPVRLQWDPDHAPDGTPQQRRAIQLGLKGEILKTYGQNEIIQVEGISDFVAEQSEVYRFLWRLDSLIFIFLSLVVLNASRQRSLCCEWITYFFKLDRVLVSQR